MYNKSYLLLQPLRIERCNNRTCKNACVKLKETTIYHEFGLKLVKIRCVVKIPVLHRIHDKRKYTLIITINSSITTYSK